MTVAEADLLESAAEVAATATVGGLGIVTGAVYFPVAPIVPQLAPVQPAPETLQVTVWLAPLGPTAAVNCCESPTCTDAVPGETLTASWAGVGGGGEDTFTPPQEVRIEATSRTMASGRLENIYGRFDIRSLNRLSFTFHLCPEVFVVSAQTFLQGDTA